jgi:hypothetical protein
MSTFELLKDAQDHDSTWTASIIVSKYRCIDANGAVLLPDDHSADSKDRFVDIVPLLKQPSTLDACLYRHELNYPVGASFCFEGYKGVADAKPLAKYIVKCALESSGTQLCIAKSHGPQKKTKRYANTIQSLLYRKRCISNISFSMLMSLLQPVPCYGL